MKRHPHPRGFVILFALGLLLFGTSTLGLLAVQGAGKALDARRLADDTCRRWTLWTAERTFLGLAPKLLVGKRGSEAGAPIIPIPQITLRLELDGTIIDAELGDENAKLNVNEIALRSSTAPSAIAEILRKATRNDEGTHQILPRPLARSVQKDYVLPPFVHPDQVIDPNYLSGRLKRFDSITIWGTGKLNIKTAKTDALLALPFAAPVMSKEILQLQGMTTGAEGLSLEDALKQMEIPAARKRWFAEKLVDQSNTFSIRIAVWDNSTTLRRFSVAMLTPSGQLRRLFGDPR